MTKMTVLHFASPFAFSMPVVPKDPVPAQSAEAAALASEGTSASVDDTSGPLRDAARTSGDVQDDGDDGLGASVLDTVLRRYGAGQHATVKAGPQDETRDAAERTPPSEDLNR